MARSGWACHGVEDAGGRKVSQTCKQHPPDCQQKIDPTRPNTASFHGAVRCSLGREHPVSGNCFCDYGIYVSTQTDDDFSYVISYAGEENLVIGTDYGHGDTSSELNAISRFKAMEGLNPQVKRKILSDNPRRFYGI
jgi:hypothetical protein